MDTKILLIDDEARIRQTFARNLKRAGYGVITAEDGPSGLIQYRREQPDIVLLDLRMPGMDGLAVLQAMREQDPEANVILCTAHGEKDAVIDALRAGASDFLPKPVDQVTLESALRRAEERIHLKRELRASQRALGQHNLRLEQEVRARTAELEREIEERKRSQEALARQEAEIRATLYGIGDAIISTDIEGSIRWMNPVAEQLTGWTEIEAGGRPLEEVFRVLDGETRRPVDDPVARTLRQGAHVGLTPRSLLVARDGCEIPISDSAAPILDSQGNVTGVVLVFRDQTEERMNRRLTETRLSLIEYATSHTLDQFLTRALDEVGALVDSPIGFYHFVGADQETITLQQWSTRTLQEFCGAEAKGMHYSVDQAGVWVDCVRQKQPVVHNDYASLPNRKGMPEGHAEVVRELVVPVMREGEVVAVLGVGNKPTEYTPADVELVSYLADVTWEIVRQKRAEEALRESEKRFKMTVQLAPIGVGIVDSEGNMIDCNAALAEMVGYSREELLRLHFADFTHPDDLEREWGLINLLWEGGTAEYRMEKRYVHKDGHIVWVDVAASLFKDETGKLAFGFAFVQELTDGKEPPEQAG